MDIQNGSLDTRLQGSNLRVSEELKFWCGVLGISQQQLASAVANAGEDAGAPRNINEATRMPE